MKEGFSSSAVEVYYPFEQMLVLEGRDLPPIDGSKIGMEPHRLVQKASKSFRDLALAGLQCF
jgi:hypothetical protein